MKTTLTIILFLVWMAGIGQEIIPGFQTLQGGRMVFKQRNIVTDSIVWKTVDTLHRGDSTCKHDWVYSDEERIGGDFGCLIDHGGYHCSYDDMIRYAICRKCLMKIQQRERWYEHEEKPPKSEYELLNDKINK